MRKSSYIAVLMLMTVFYSSAQEKMASDPCGFPDTTSLEYKIASSGNWGYGYDTLLYDLAQWKKSPFVIVDSIGATVQNRTMFLMTIQDTTKISHARKRVWIHARTHPGEVQGTWVTNEIIKILLSNSSLGKKLRDSCVFNIVPMYNPDGVELGKARENAHDVDIESNWNVDTSASEPEVKVLRKIFTRLMTEPNPIQIALNMHSSTGTKRFFVYHTVKGTSQLYSTIQIKFIDTVRYNFPGGIQPYNYSISWKDSAARQYPESWFWFNHKEKVLALTYEDMNDISANSFDKTANAIARGIADQLGIFGTSVSFVENGTVPTEFLLWQNFPNPFNPTTIIKYQLPIANHVSLRVYDILGREVATLINEAQLYGTHSVTFNASSLSSGVYVYRLITGNIIEIKKMQLIR